jgi:tetratricopeptide (TPR) repeat protein
MDTLWSEQDEDRLRVFVSSTFSDLRTERDYLARFTFPAIESICRERGLAFSAIDLRWGITDEQVAEGQVLPICLEEIDRARPFFIGLLGQRYGWIPDTRPVGLTQRYEWLEREHGKSITELEMVHGALSQGRERNTAFFYARTPVYSDEASSESEEDPRLRELKQRIRASGRSMRSFTTPQELGGLVLEDFKSLLSARWVDSSSPLARATARHRAVFRDALRGYIPRERLSGRLDELASVGSAVVVTGGAGSGRTSLVADWAARTASAGTRVILFSCAANGESLRWPDVGQRIGDLAAAETGDRFDPPGSPDQVRGCLERALRRAASGRSLALVIDAADMLPDDDGTSALAFLPAQPPPGCSYVITAQTGSAAEHHALRRGWVELNVGPLHSDEIGPILESHLAQAGRALTGRLIEAFASKPIATSPLALAVIPHELGITASHETLELRLGEYLTAPTPDALLSEVLHRWESDYEFVPGFTRGVLTALWASRRGLSDMELTHLSAATGTVTPMARLAPLLIGAGQLLSGTGDLVAIRSQILKSAIEKRYLSSETDRREAYSNLAEFFLARDPECREPRTLDELPWLLAKSGRMGDLAGILSDCGVLPRLYHQDQSQLLRWWGDLQRSGIDLADTYAVMIEDPETPLPALEAVALVLEETSHHDLAARAMRAIQDLTHATSDLATSQQLAMSRALIAAEGGHFEEAVQDFAEALARAAALRSDERIAAAFLGRAQARRDLKDLKRALDDLEEAERFALRASEYAIAASVVATRSDILHMRGVRASELVAHLEKALEFARKSGDDLVIQSVLATLETARLDAHGASDEVNLREAEHLALIDGGRDVWLLNSAILARARAAEVAGQWIEACSHYREAEAHARRRDDRSLIGICLVAQAQLTEIIPSQEQVRLLEEAIEVLPASSDLRSGAANLLVFACFEEADRLTAGEAGCSGDKVGEAMRLLARARGLCLELDDPILLADTLMQMGLACQAADPTQALDLHGQAGAIYRGPRRRPLDRVALGWALCHQAASLISLSRQAEARNLLAEASTHFRKDSVRQGLERVRALERMAQVAAPGWYSDPWRASTYRYWDGGKWTGHVHPAIKSTPS